jgi:hypothetical protein
MTREGGQMTGAMKPIETRYNGNKFRSRLEARWAVFLDSLGVQYRYEHEGWDLDGVWYLPDFWLPEIGMWLEIKPDLPGLLSGDGLLKAERLAIASDKPVIVMVDTPGRNPAIVLVGPLVVAGADPIFGQWSDCLACGKVSLGAVYVPEENGRRGFCGCAAPNVPDPQTSPRLKAAATTANEFRF